MSVESRINKKSGEVEYRVHFRFNDGIKVKQTNTSWYESASKAQQAANLFIKENTNRELKKKTESNDLTFETVYNYFLNDLEVKATKKTTKNISSDVTMFRRAKTVLAKYTPKEILKKDFKDITKYDFKKWLSELNQKNIAGATVRNYKSVILEFNSYCDENNYYQNDNQADDTLLLLSKFRLKQKNEGKKEDRYLIKLADVIEIGSYYKNNGKYGIGSYVNEYWYNLFYFLFFTGMRVEELIGLQWKNVKFDGPTPIVKIENAISEREPRENVLDRLKKGIYHTKNKSSKRSIPMLEYYRDMLKSFKNSTMIKFGYNEETIQNAFVFPNIRAKDDKDKVLYTSTKNILRELDKVCAKLGIPKTDSQMFRHGCATLLVLPKADGGLELNTEELIRYFGHTDSKMLNEVYATLDEKQSVNKLTVVLGNLVGTKTQLFERPNDLIQRLVNPKLNITNVKKSHYCKVKNQIDNAIGKGQATFKVYPEDIDVVNEYKENYLKENNRRLEDLIEFTF